MQKEFLLFYQKRKRVVVVDCVLQSKWKVDVNKNQPKLISLSSRQSKGLGVAKLIGCTLWLK